VGDAVDIDINDVVDDMAAAQTRKAARAATTGP
jgi:hypothetical protein